MLTGAGSTFCSGMDLKEAASVSEGAEAEQTTIAILQQFADLLQCLHTLPKPTIAAVYGDAFAGGAGLMAACDLVVAADMRGSVIRRSSAAWWRRSSCTICPARSASVVHASCF